MFGLSRRRTSGAAATALLALSLAVSAAAPAFAADRQAGPAAVAADKVKVIVTFDGPPDRASEQAIERAGGKVGRRLGLVNAIAADVPRGRIKQLAADRGVRRVELDARLTAFDHGPDTGDHEYENAWGVEHIGSAVAHAAGVRGAGVKVAVIDTGIDYIHDDPDDTPYVVDPEFSSNYRGGYDFANDDADPLDDNGHGTHVSGILAAEKNGYLVVGVAPAVDLYALKILDANGEGDVSNLILALQWALDNDIDVVNMSLGTHEVSPALAAAVQAAHAQGLLMVAASGNVNPLSWEELFFGCPVAYPGAYPEVLSTTFTNGNDALTGFSCTGPEVDFAAPGDQVHSTVPTGTCMFCTPYGYSPQSGTSMASPHLAGTVALLLSQGIADGGPAGLLDDVRSRLCSTADTGFGVNSTPIPASDPRYPTYFGCGVVDADGAVLAGGPPPNRAPVAGDDSAVSAEDGSVTVPVLANDTDPDGDAVAIGSVGDPPHGAASLDASGQAVVYTPDPNFNGTDSFTYTVSDGNGGTDGATVGVTVTPINDPPVAVDDTVAAAEDMPSSVDVVANDTDIDGDTLAVAAVGDPAHGSAVVGSDGSVVYTPEAGYSGSDAFDYTVSDGLGGDTGSVSVTVGAVDDPPTASAVSASTTAPTPVTVTLTGTDPDTCELTFQVVDLPDHGGVGALTNAACTAGAPSTDRATVVYTPDAGYSGPDAFTYRVLDGTTASAVATVSVAVAAGPSQIHVGDLDATASTNGKNWTARVTIRIHTGAHSAVSGAIVTGTWSNGASGTASCTTGSNGACTVQKTKLARASIASVTFTVTSATRSGNVYGPGSNHDPDGDSTGSSILVMRPS